jgi:acetyl/propionyl-CoA carboxylase alpha subunit
MKSALKECDVGNIKTTIPYLLRIMDDHRFRSGEYCTGLVDKINEDDHHHHLKGIMQKLMESFHLWHDE